MIIQFITDSHLGHIVLWCRDQVSIWFTTDYTQRRKCLLARLHAEVDFFLSQMNVLLSKVNEKLDECPAKSRSVILPRINHIVSELEWMMSLSTKDSQTEDDEEGNFYLFRCFLAAAQLVFLRRGKFVMGQL